MPRHGAPARLERRRTSPFRPVWLLLAALVQALLLLLLAVIEPWLVPPDRGNARPVSLMIVQPPPEVPLDEEDPDQDYEGQIVEVAPPLEEEVPEDAEYLAEYDQVVPEETRSEKFEINPEVLSPEFSREQQAEEQDVVDLNVEKESTGATVGNHRFDPNVDGTMAAIPSPWEKTNREGPMDPVRSSQRQAVLSGAPQNDLLDEVRGEVVSLNTLKYPYAGYMDRIRRQVNFWWKQNIDNLPSSARLSQSRYLTEVEVILNADGALELIEVTRESGSDLMDDCVVRAFRLAGPFENPPEGLIQKDGRVYLPDFDFTVSFGTARMQYQGIDPRAGVQFPGILKSPR
ncbi:MAG: TonB C-terminal domain-containing protein [Myxococcales bacterium]|nr:TonB C-terminal domain-containing protein [Myxococcales bacterium]